MKTFRWSLKAYPSELNFIEVSTKNIQWRQALSQALFFCSAGCKSMACLTAEWKPSWSKRSSQLFCGTLSYLVFIAMPREWYTASAMRCLRDACRWHWIAYVSICWLRANKPCRYGQFVNPSRLFSLCCGPEDSATPWGVSEWNCCPTFPLEIIHQTPTPAEAIKSTTPRWWPLLHLVKYLKKKIKKKLPHKEGT